jgi:hypothetical protein
MDVDIPGGQRTEATVTSIHLNLVQPSSCSTTLTTIAVFLLRNNKFKLYDIFETVPTIETTYKTVKILAAVRPVSTQCMLKFKGEKHHLVSLSYRSPFLKLLHLLAF